MENKIDKKILIGIIIVLFFAGGVFAWEYFQTKEPTLEKANEILIQANQNTLNLTSYTIMGDIEFQIKNKETIFFRVTGEDIKFSSINSFDFANQDSSMAIKYNVMMNFQAIVESIKNGITPEELEELKEPIPMLGINLYDLLTTMRALGESNISVTIETKTIDFNNYTKIVEITGLRELLNQVGGIFLANMIMNEIDPYIGVWHKTPADPEAQKETMINLKKIEQLIPSLFDIVYVKEVLPNTKIDDVPVYNFATGIDLNNLKDVFISLISIIAERDDMGIIKEELETSKTKIIEAWPEVVQVIETINMEFKTYISRNNLIIRDIVKIDMNLYDLLTTFNKIALEQGEIMPSEEMIRFKKIKEASRDTNISIRTNFNYSEHNAVPVIMPPTKYEIIEPRPKMPTMDFNDTSEFEMMPF